MTDTIEAEDTREATRRQKWAIFTNYGYDVRDSDLTFTEASDLIEASMANFDGWDKDELISILEEAGGIKKGETKVDKSDKFQKIYDEAVAAGKKAADECTPTPMAVVEHVNPLDDNSAIKQVYPEIKSGVCGFAWVNIKPGNHPFSNWLKKHDLARRDSYYGGVTVWVSDYEQSMELKQAFAGAFSRSINDAFADDKKFSSYSASRMD